VVCRIAFCKNYNWRGNKSGSEEAPTKFC